MNYEAQITEQEGIIDSLTAQLKQTRLPARTVDWQHKNIGVPRNITQRVLVVRKQRKKINSGVATSKRKIMSLRESILSRDAVIAIK